MLHRAARRFRLSLLIAINGRKNRQPVSKKNNAPVLLNLSALLPMDCQAG